MRVVGVSPKPDHRRGGDLSVQQDLASVGTSTQSRPFVTLVSDRAPPPAFRLLLRGAPSLGSISLIVRSLQARLCWFGRQLVHTTRRVLFGPPDHLVRNFNDREPRWLIRSTLFCWPGIAVHYGTRQLPHPGIWAYFKDETEHTTRCGLQFEFPRPRWRSKKLRKYSFCVRRSPDPRPIPSPAQPDTVSEPDTVKEPDRVKEPDTVSEPDTVKEPDRVKEPDTVSEPDTVKEPDRVKEPDTVGEPDTVKEPDTVEEPDRVSEPSNSQTATVTLFHRDPDTLLQVHPMEPSRNLLEQDFRVCQVEKARAESALSERDEKIRILEDRLESCQEERDDTARELKNREKMLTLLVERRTDLMEYINREIQNTGEHVTPLLKRITMHDLSTISDFLQAQDEAIKRRDGDSEPDLATSCASIMAEPATLTYCAAILAGVQAEKECLEDANDALFLRVLMLRRTLFALRKRTWTVAIVRDVGDMMAGQEPPPLTDFFSIEKGDNTHLVCRSVADISTSSSISFKSYLVDDVFIAQSNSMIEGILTALITRAFGKHDVCFIADGQSGSGKSYTLFNGPDALAPGIGNYILNKEHHPYELTVTCTALEVSQDGLKDLLGAEGSPATGGPSLRVRGGRSRKLS